MEISANWKTIMLLLYVECSKSAMDELAQALLADAAASDESNSEKLSKEMRQYHKFLSKQEQNYYKKKFKKEISQEEKDQVQYFEDLLKKIKSMNARKKIHYK